ncbi:MAG: 50S ribosomal protein L3 N(5)-glutamine methyltransferase [Lysobacterales bacterium]|jgi:ribosomal protein L3 glutamine methyltransferase
MPDSQLQPPASEAATVADCIERAAARLEDAGLFFGHGTDNARDEATWLVLHAVNAPLDGSFSEWGAVVGPDARAEIDRLIEARCTGGEPLAYLTGSAWFAGLEFEVTREVLVPRSPIAELVQDRFRPWLDPDKALRVLDLCTGCGCIGIAAARYLPRARVDAADISPTALRVAARNVRRHGMESRVSLIESDLFHSIPGNRYDLIVSNPPYVPLGDIGALPTEYRSEPSLGLASGGDGLDAAMEILLRAPDFLADAGVLICEVGESEQRLSELLPRVPFLWLEFETGGEGVFLLDRRQLLDARGDVEAALRKRQHVA